MEARAELSEIISQTAQQVLQAAESPVVRYKILHEVLKRPAKDSAVLEAYQGVLSSPLVAQLAAEQWDDGSWGRLHTMDTQARQRFGTTEIGVARARALGLKPDHPILHKAAQHLAEVIRTGQVRDRAEKNDRWPTGLRLFAAAALAQIEPEHPSVNPIFDLWLEISRRSFSTGNYDPDAEAAAHADLTGAKVRGSYLVVHNKYAYILLSARLGSIPKGLEQDLVKHAWGLTEGIKYLSTAADQIPPLGKAGVFENWFRTQELLSRFPTWGTISGDSISWLAAWRNPGGWWDFGPRAGTPEVLPLSDNWRRKNTRRVDWTTRVLVLLSRFADCS